VLAAALGVTTAFDAGPQAAVLAGAAAATFLLSLALTAGRSAPIPFALLLLGAIYAIPHGDRAIPAPFYGSGLLLTAELAYWSLDERVRQRVQAGVARPRLLAILAVAAAAIPASALVLIAAEADVARSPGLTAAGAAAVVACIGLLIALARSHIRREHPDLERGSRCAARPALSRSCGSGRLW
jgi:hypothetical protein